MNITYQVEKYADVKEELEPLAIAHHLEEDPRKETTSIDIDWEMYSALEDTGSFILVTARDGETLVGYLSFIISETPHIKGYLQAVSDALFIDKAFRGKEVASNLIKLVEEVLSGVGVDWMVLVFPSNERSEVLMNRLGYNKTDVMYGKSLGEN